MNTERSRYPSARPALTRVQYKPPEAHVGAVQRCAASVLTVLYWTGLVIVNLKKILLWAGVALVLFYVISTPSNAAGLVTHILDTLKSGASSLITFVRSLFG